MNWDRALQVFVVVLLFILLFMLFYLHRFGKGQVECLTKMYDGCIASCREFQPPLGLIRVEQFRDEEYATHCICFGKEGERTSARKFKYKTCISEVIWGK